MSEVESDGFLYFAYGSNICSQRLRLSNPTAELVMAGSLANHELQFRGPVGGWLGSPATIVPKQGTCVYGVLISSLCDITSTVYRLAAENSDSLDSQEFGYNRKSVTVSSLDGKIAKDCRTYQLKEPAINTAGLPSPHYKHVILCGARENKLPTAYIKWLDSLPDNQAPGTVPFKLKVLDAFYESRRT